MSTDSFFRRSEMIKLLSAHWPTILDGPKIMKRALVDARDSEYRTVFQKDTSVSVKTGVTITKFEITNNGLVELWVEFAVPKSDGVIIGSHVYEGDLAGEMKLKETFGTLFLPEKRCEE